METQKTSILGTEKIGKLLVLFAVPSVISLVLNALYNMVDQIFIGQGVGYLANGATNVIFPLVQLAVALALLIGDGTASFMNIKLGQGDSKAAEKGMAAGITALIIIGIVLAVISYIFLEQICTLFGATESTMPYALDYGRIIAVGIPFCIFSGGTMSMIRADGSPKTAMMGMVAGCIINLIGDPLTIFVFKMGVKGAALATIIGQIVNAVINIAYLFHCKSIRLKKSSFKNSLPYIPKVSKLGISSFSTQFLIMVVVAVQNNLLVKYGAFSKYGAEIPMTAVGITMKVFSILQCAITGLAAGAQPIVSYNYGSKQYDRVRETLKKLILISVGIMAVATVWFQIAPMSIIRMFGSESELYNEFSMKCLRIFLSLIIVDSIQMTGSIFLQSIGKPVQATLLVFLRQVIILIPATFIIPVFMGVEGILFSGPVASIVAGAAAVIFLSKEWKNLKKD